MVSVQIPEIVLLIINTASSKLTNLTSANFVSLPFHILVYQRGTFPTHSRITTDITTTIDGIDYYAINWPSSLAWSQGPFQHCNIHAWTRDQHVYRGYRLLDCRGVINYWFFRHTCTMWVYPSTLGLHVPQVCRSCTEGFQINPRDGKCHVLHPLIKMDEGLTQTSYHVPHPHAMLWRGKCGLSPQTFIHIILTKKGGGGIYHQSDPIHCA